MPVFSDPKTLADIFTPKIRVVLASLPNLAPSTPSTGLPHWAGPKWQAAAEKEIATRDSPTLRAHLVNPSFAGMAHDDTEPLTKAEAAVRKVDAPKSSLLFEAIDAALDNLATSRDSYGSVSGTSAFGNVAKTLKPYANSFKRGLAEFALTGAALEHIVKAAPYVDVDARDGNQQRPIPVFKSDADLVDIYKTLKTIPRDRTMQRIADDVNRPGSTLQKAGRVASDIGRNPGVLGHMLAESAPSLAIGGVGGKVAAAPVESVAATVSANLAKRLAVREAFQISTPLVERLAMAGARVAPMSAYGATMNATATAAGLGTNVAAELDDGQDVDGASQRGVAQTAAQLPVQTAAGALLPLQPFRFANPGVRIGANVALQSVIQSAAAGVSTYHGNEAVGRKTTPGEVVAAMLSQALFAPMEMAGQGLHARTGVREEAATFDAILAKVRHLDDLADAAQASSLRVHAQDMFKRFVAAIAPQGKVYVPVRVLTHHVSSPEGMEALRSMPEVVAQVPRAIDEGGNVEIPLSDYATHIAGVPEAHKEFRDHVRFEPDGPTRSEVLMALEQRIGQTRADYDAAVNQAEEPQAFQASAQAVRDDIAANLNNASPLTGQINDHIAEQVAQAHAVYAAQLGIMPEEVWGKYAEKRKNNYGQLDVADTVAPASDDISGDNRGKNSEVGISTGAGETVGRKGSRLLPSEGEVGTYRDLIAAGFKGDGLTPHHIPSSNRMALEGISKGDGIAMNMEHPYSGGGGRHRATFTYGTQADVDMAMRDALAAGIWDARRIYMADDIYSSEIRASLRKIILMNKSTHSDVFRKKKP